MANAVLLLLQVPPVEASNKAVVWPAQIVNEPVIAAGELLTVTDLVAKQPPVKIYEIVVVPTELPITRPVDDPISATAGLLLLHTPPLMASVSSDVVPVQLNEEPDMGVGVVFTENSTAA